jgi:4-amino-4-deoxy-L-arabinose transferase-like glycosyltransferase
MLMGTAKANTGIRNASGTSPGHLFTFINAHKVDILMICAIIVLSMGVGLYGLMDAGITWDEPLTIMAGMKYGHNVETLNFSPEAWSMVMEHGPLSKYIYGAALGLAGHRTLDYQAFVICKTVAVIMGTLTCILAFIVGREIYDRLLGFGAAAILALIPDFVAHSQQAAIDNPIALFFTLTIALFLLGRKYNNKYLYTASAVSLGLLIDTKYNGLLAIPIMALFYLIYVYLDKPAKKGRKAASGRPLKDYLPVVPAAIFLGITALTIYILWPWLWADPIGQFKLSFMHWEYTPIEYFLGNSQKATPLYYVAYFLVTTPLLLFIPLAIGAYRSIRSRNPYKLAILLWLVVPFTYSFGSFIQDGMRYLLMIYPAMAILAADGLAGIASWAAPKVRGISQNGVYVALAALTIIYLLYSLASVQPYYLDYYNSLAGGPAGVHDNRLFEFGWWGEGVYESIMYLDNNAAPGSTVLVATKPNQMLKYYGKNLTYIYPDTDYFYANGEDYIVVNHYTEEYAHLYHDESGYKLVHETTVQGAPLVKVFQKIT